MPSMHFRHLYLKCKCLLHKATGILLQQAARRGPDSTPPSHLPGETR
jgi:hypothetical protein